MLRAASEKSKGKQSKNRVNSDDFLDLLEKLPFPQTFRSLESENQGNASSSDQQSSEHREGPDHNNSSSEESNSSSKNDTDSLDEEEILRKLAAGGKGRKKVDVRDVQFGRDDRSWAKGSKTDNNNNNNNNVAADTAAHNNSTNNTSSSTAVGTTDEPDSSKKAGSVSSLDSFFSHYKNKGLPAAGVSDARISLLCLPHFLLLLIFTHLRTSFLTPTYVCTPSPRTPSQLFPSPYSALSLFSYSPITTGSPHHPVTSFPSFPPYSPRPHSPRSLTHTDLLTEWREHAAEARGHEGQDGTRHLVEIQAGVAW